MRKKVTGVIVSALIACLMAGCTKATELTEEQNDIIAQYAANIIIEKSFDYDKRYKERPSQEETASSEETSDGETTPDSTETVPEETTTASPQENSIFTSALGINNVTVAYKGYNVTKEYPDNEDALFTFGAQEGYSFVVLNLTINNNGAQAVNINTYNEKPIYKIKVNNKTYNNYANLMHNDISGLQDITIAAGSSYDAILVFMVEDEKINNVTSMQVTYKTSTMRII